jgi:hypothetical protein
MLDKRKGPGAGGAEDPSKNDSAEHRSNSEKGDGSKVPPDFLQDTAYFAGIDEQMDNGVRRCSITC